jgi:hypothetical protein
METEPVPLALPETMCSSAVFEPLAAELPEPRPSTPCPG